MPTGTDRLNVLTRLRRDQEKTVAFVLGKNQDLGHLMLGCGTWLHFREWLDHGGEARLLNANFCKKHTLCRTCAARRAVRLVEAYQPKIAAIEAQNASLVPVHVVLSLKSGLDVAERIAHLKASWKRMGEAKRKGASASGRHAVIEWNKVAGCLRSIEATFNPAEGWHVHCHIFALLSSFINKFALSDEWQRFTGDSSVTWITKCYGEDTRKALHEVIKYACKFSDLTDELLWEFHLGASGHRMFDPSGILRGVKEPELDQDDITGLTGPYRDWIAIWRFLEKSWHIQDGPPTQGMMHHALTTRA